MDRPDMTLRPGARPQQHPVAQQTYDGDWSDWVARLPAEPAPPPAPDYYRHEEALANMIDRRPRRNTRRWLPALLGSLGAAALLFAAFMQFRPNPQPAAVASSTPTQVAAAPAPAAQCPPERVGSRIQGNGAGGADSGPAAIFAFQYAYYVARSGDQARTVVAANASVSNGSAIQQGIDSIPVGTTHCVSIAPGAFVGQYLVQVTEYRPNITQSIVYNPQVVTTARVGNKTLITSIGAAH
jgi:hypothetical protein